MRGRIRADDGFFFLMALLLLTLPLRWVLACFLAAMVHELGHALAVLLCGGRITGVMLSFRGARMDAAPLPVGAELVCVLAGYCHGFRGWRYADLSRAFIICCLWEDWTGQGQWLVSTACGETVLLIPKKNLQTAPINSTIGTLCSKR